MKNNNDVFLHRRYLPQKETVLRVGSALQKPPTRLIQNETRSPAIIRKMDEKGILGLAQEKFCAIIEAFLPPYGRESRNHIAIK